MSWYGEVVYTALLILIIFAAIVAVAGLVVALKAWFSLNRKRRVFQSDVVDEIAALSARTSELERGVNDLSYRASELPFRISELQQSIAILQTITKTLSVTLLQVSKVLTLPGLKVFSATEFERGLDNLSDAVSRRTQR